MPHSSDYPRKRVRFTQVLLLQVSPLLLATIANATSPCYEWRMGTPYPVGPAYITGWYSDPGAACDEWAAHAVPVMNANDSFNEYRNANGMVVITGAVFPNSYACLLTYERRPKGTAQWMQGGAFDRVISTRTNPNGCQVYVSALPEAPAQCGPTCNGVGHPINPASGAVYDTLIDLPGSGEHIPFKRFYNSSDSGAGLSAGWRHSFSRNIKPKYSSSTYKAYGASADHSSLYNDEALACTSGFTQIKSRVSSWTNATASYTNGVCALTVGTTLIGTLPLYYTSPPTPAPGTTTIIAFNATRDDGQLVSFLKNGSSITAPPGISLKLQQTASGFTLTDAEDNFESYDTNGKLLSITSRAGVVQTIGYDGSGRLSTVTDSFGRSLTLTYDSQGRLSTVTRQ